MTRGSGAERPFILRRRSIGLTSTSVGTASAHSSHLLSPTMIICLRFPRQGNCMRKVSISIHTLNLNLNSCKTVSIQLLHGLCRSTLSLFMPLRLWFTFKTPLLTRERDRPRISQKVVPHKPHEGRRRNKTPFEVCHCFRYQMSSHYMYVPAVIVSD